jgi:hypothetical protein
LPPPLIVAGLPAGASMVKFFARSKSPCVSVMVCVVKMSMVSPFWAWATAQRSVFAAPLSALLVTFSVEGSERSSSDSSLGRKPGCGFGDRCGRRCRADGELQNAGARWNHMVDLPS